ncbi:Unknown protein, partial [Striga hermonthica]
NRTRFYFRTSVIRTRDMKQYRDALKALIPPYSISVRRPPFSQASSSPASHLRHVQKLTFRRPPTPDLRSPAANRRLTTAIFSPISRRLRATSAYREQARVLVVSTKNPRSCSPILLFEHHLTIAQFRDYHPEKFSSQGDPRVVDEWVQGLEMIFEVMECPDRYRVLCAQIQLTGDARLWWNAYCGMRPGENEGCTWDRFKELIREKYYPAYYRADMERQFLALKQGTRAVDEYEREFTRLGAFVPDLVSTEAKRSRRFTDGLLPVVVHNIVGHGVQTYARTVTIAQEVDASIRREANHDRLQPIAPAQSSLAPPVQPAAAQQPKDKKRKGRGFQTDRRIRPKQPGAARPQQ